MAQFTIEVKSISAIAKLKTLGRRKGEYISKLIEQDIEIEELKKRIAKLEGERK